MSLRPPGRRRSSRRATEYLDNPHITMVAHRVEATGGQEEVHRQLITELLKRCHAVTLVTGRTDLIPTAGLDVVHVRGPARPSSVRFPTFFLESARLVARHGRGLIHTSGPISATPTDVMTLHFCHDYYHAHVGLPRSARATPWHAANERLFSRMALGAEHNFLGPGRVGRVVPVSQGLSDEIVRQYPRLAGNTTVIDNGWSPAKVHAGAGVRDAARDEVGAAPDDLLVLFAGGDWQRKGLAVALRALPAAPRWTLLVAGRGDEAQLSKDAASAGVSRRVHALGFRSDMARWYAAADAFVLPTAYEAAPLVAYEAAAAGLPLIAPPVNGLDRLLDAGAGISTARDPEAIAASLQTLEQAPARHAMSQVASMVAQRFTWSHAADRYVELYRAVAEHALRRK